MPRESGPHEEAVDLPEARRRYSGAAGHSMCGQSVTTRGKDAYLSRHSTDLACRQLVVAGHFEDQRSYWPGEGGKGRRTGR